MSNMWQIFEVVDILVILHEIEDFNEPDFVAHNLTRSKQMPDLRSENDIFKKGTS
jgi:aminoglycoside phosphotransferase (APT) family kinase protein